MSETIDSIEYYRSLMVIDKNDLDNELEQHAVIYEQIGEQLATACALRDEAKDNTSRATAKAAHAIRQEFEANNEKISEAKINSLLPATKEVNAATQVQVHYKLEADNWSSLKEAWDARGKMLRELCHLYTAGYWQRQPVKEGKNTLETEEAKAVREELGKKRKKLDKGVTANVDEEENELEHQEEQPTRRRRRKAEEEPEATDTVPETEADAEEEQPTRSRRRRKAEEEVNEFDGDVEEEATNDDTEEEEEEKPRRSRRRRKSEPEEEPEEATDDDSEEEEEEQPTRSRRRRRAEPEEAETTSDDEPEEEEEKPRRSRRRKAEAEEPEADEPTSDEVVNPETGRRRRVRRRES